MANYWEDIFANENIETTEEDMELLRKPCIIFFVTEDQELASGHKSHRGGPQDSSFWDQLEAAGIKAHKIIHIEFILVNDGGAFANNAAWLAALLARE